MSDFLIAQMTDLHFTTRRDWLNPVQEAMGGLDALRRAYAHWFQSEEKNGFSSVFYPSGYNPDAAQQALHSILRDSVDAVLVTGDLATTGEDPDVRLAVEYLKGSAPEWWHGGGQIPALVGTVPVLIMPGNHDRYAGMVAMPVSRQFERHLGPYWDLGQEITYSHKLSHDESGYVRIATFGREDKRLGIVMADMSLQSSHDAQGGLFAYYGQGNAYPVVLKEMVEMTTSVYQEAAEEGLQAVVFWAIHFPPEFPGIDVDLALLSGSDVIRAAAASHVPLIVAGHTHQTVEYMASWHGQDVRIICSGPTCGLGASGQYAYTVLEIDILEAQRMAVKPRFFKWVDSRFDEQSHFPSIGRD